MELETIEIIQSNYKYNTFFYANVCHVCKRFGYDVPLMRCTGCKMIRYCGKQHQKQHWPEHKSLCKVIRKVLKDEDIKTHNITWQERYEMKLELIETISSNLNRPMEQYEKQMFRFPRECVICYEQDIKLLADCRNCTVSLCKDHKNDTRHKDICAPLELCLQISITVLPISEGILLKAPYLKKFSNLETFQDMKDFLKIYGISLPTGWKITNDMLLAEHSEYITCPLTLFHAMQVSNYVLNSEELVIHIVGAIIFGEIELTGWEILLHVIGTKSNIKSLVIIVIGTELKSISYLKSYFKPVCDVCLSRGKNILLQFRGQLYESYVRSQWFVKPDLIVGFNTVGFHDIGGSKFKTDLGTWESFVQTLEKYNCLFVLTSYSRQEIRQFVMKINIILDREVDYFYDDKNPFASLRPFRSLGPEQVVFQNDFMVISRSLCS